VLVEGIDSATELRVALDCGADLLVGDLLARPALAGSIFNAERRRIDGLLETQDRNSAKVIPLFA